MITQNFNTGRLVTTTKKYPVLATAVEKYIESRTVPIVQKKCQNCDKFGYKGSLCRNIKIIRNRVRHTKSEDKSDKVVRKYITVKVLNKTVRFQLDSGSELSIINLQTWRKLNRSIIKMTSKTARTVTGDKIKFDGEIIIPVSLNGIAKKLKVFVLKNTENLFGWDWFQKFNLWDQPINTFCQKVECITAEAEKIKMELKGSFPEVFSAGLGKRTKIKATFELKENTRPIFRKKRNVPFSEEINKELDRLVNMGILSKVEFSEWAAPTVCIRKKSKEIRVCVDFSTGLNAALKDYHYPLPSPEEVFNKLNGGKDFSKIDLSEAYLQIPVEENSSKLFCINTHRGLYKFDRLVFGIKRAPAIFQQVMDTMLGGFDFTFAYLDDD